MLNRPKLNIYYHNSNITKYTLYVPELLDVMVYEIRFLRVIVDLRRTKIEWFSRQVL